MSTTTIDWNDAAVQAQVMARVNLELHRMGSFLVPRMQQYAPVDTGALRAGIHETVDETAHTLTVHIPAPYAIYQEFGTRFIKPHPYARPAILDAMAYWPITHVEFILHPAPQRSEPLIASASGFRLPRRQKLTAAQESHVRKHLIPTSKKLAATFRRRGAKFTVRKFQ